MGVRFAAALAAFWLAAMPVTVFAAWDLVAGEPGKRVEIDRSSIITDPYGDSTARGRIVLEKPIVDPKTSSAYRIIEVQNRFDCTERTLATLKRSYYKEEGELLRQEEVKNPFDMPVRSGSPDDKLLREVCRPKSGAEGASSVSKTAELVGEASDELRKYNEALVDSAVKKDVQRLSAKAGAALSKPGGRSSASTAKQAASVTPALAWSYDGSSGPEHWGTLKPEFSACASGRYQSPIDLNDGIAVDLAPIQFNYLPTSFRVVDNGRNLQATVYGGGIVVQGKKYELIRVQFHRPAEMAIAGKHYDMDAQLIHKAEDGKLAILTVLLEKGTENPVVQMVLNNLPLEKGGEVAPVGQNIDVSRLLPGDQRYFTFMGSLTTPPCTEDVLWLVLKTPQQMSPDQLTIFQRLYPPNARPVQPAFDRIVKESR